MSRRRTGPAAAPKIRDLAPRPAALSRSRAAGSLVEDLTAQIREGALHPGSLVASGPALSRQYGISYQTVVRALEALVQRGWLVRQHGRGTYVASHPPREPAGAQVFAPTVLLALDPRALERGRFGFAIVEALDEALAHAGLRLRYAPLSGAGEAALRDELSQGRGDVKLLAALDRPAFLEQFLRLCPSLPALAVHALPERLPRRACCDAVLIDDRAGGALAGEYLCERGHRRIGYLGGPKRDRRARERGDGLQAVLRRHGMAPALEAWAVEWEERAGRAASRKLLKRLTEGAKAHPSSAVFCANDRLAAGLYEACAESGWRIPNELSVVGFDDQKIAAELAPPLTTFRIDRAEYGRQAARLVKERLAQPGRAPRLIRLPVTLVERASVRSG